MLLSTLRKEKSKQCDEAIKIPSNHMSLAERAGKIRAYKVRSVLNLLLIG